MSSTSENRGPHGRRAATSKSSSFTRTGKPGRRRAASQTSTLEHLWQATPKVPTQRAAAVAVAGVLIAAIAPAGNSAPAQEAQMPDAANLEAASSTTPIQSKAVSAGADLSALSFTGVSASSQTDPTKSATPSKETASKEAPKVDASADTVQALNDPAAAKAFAASQLGGFGWAQDQMSCLTSLWEKESNWRTTAENPSSLAYGIAQSLPAQKMASVGADYRTNFKTQVTWGLGYIKERYGSPCAAWGKSQAVGWY